jgi:hypothetical protein
MFIFNMIADGGDFVSTRQPTWKLFVEDTFPHDIAA